MGTYVCIFSYLLFGRISVTLLMFHRLSNRKKGQFFSGQDFLLAATSPHVPVGLCRTLLRRSRIAAFILLVSLLSLGGSSFCMNAMNTFLSLIPSDMGNCLSMNLISCVFSIAHRSHGEHAVPHRFSLQLNFIFFLHY